MLRGAALADLIDAALAPAASRAVHDVISADAKKERCRGLRHCGRASLSQLELLDLGKGGAQGLRPGRGQLAKILILLGDALLAAQVEAVAFVNNQIDGQANRQVRAQRRVER